MIDIIREDSAARPTLQAGEVWRQAATWAMEAGRGAARLRNWVVDEGVERRPAATLGAAFALGVITGWLIKRR